MPLRQIGTYSLLSHSVLVESGLSCARTRPRTSETVRCLAKQLLQLHISIHFIHPNKTFQKKKAGHKGDLAYQLLVYFRFQERRKVSDPDPYFARVIVGLFCIGIP